MEFSESKLTFTFQEAIWWVIKFDENIDYKKVRDRLENTKAVDFIATTYKDERLLFIEVKNFRNFTSDKASRERLTNDGDGITTEIAQKVKDSLACILAASRNSTHNIENWKNACSIITENRPIQIIAWIEEDEQHNLFAIKSRKAKLINRQDKLKSKLNWLTSKVSITNLQLSGSNAIEGLSVNYQEGE